MCETYHNNVGHGELDCGSRDFSARWLAVLAAKEHVELLELFTRPGEEVVVLRQTPSVINTPTHAFIVVFVWKLGSSGRKAEATGYLNGQLSGCC